MLNLFPIDIVFFGESLPERFGKLAMEVSPTRNWITTVVVVVVVVIVIVIVVGHSRV